jgi:hypothetical protein
MRTFLVLALLAAVSTPASAACSCCDAPPASTPAKSAPAAPSPAASIDVGGCCATPAVQPAPATPTESVVTGSTAATPAPAAPVGHPLKGVIVEVIEGRSSLLVKHEEIPGFMKAMTMLLKVDAPTLAAAKKGQAITATLLKKSDGWWIEGVSAK